MSTATTTSSVPVVRTRRRSLLPVRDEWIDAGLLTVLSMLALIGFRTTYDGVAYLAVGISGLLLGLVIAHAANRFDQPWITVAALSVAAFFLLGGAIAARGGTAAGVIPTIDTLTTLAHGAVHGWKELLTTLPPVDGTGPLLVVPYILGLVTGAAGFSLARRVTNAWLPVLVPVALLIAVILLGTESPAALLAQGVAFGAVALGWIALRHRRYQPVVATGSRSSRRPITAVLVLVAVALGSVFLGSHMPGADTSTRTVLRDYVEPPFNIAAYPSPLVGFRKYTKPRNLLYNRVLFRVTSSGLPADYVVRIATLDDYDRSVWGATSGSQATSPGQPADVFQRVGPTITVPTQGQPGTVTITVSPDYASARDLSAWVPTVGEVSGVQFQGANSTDHSASFRYNLATSAMIVPDRLRAGDQYTLNVVLPPQPSPPTTGSGFGTSPLDPSSYTFLNNQITKWIGPAASGTAWQQLAGIETTLTQGAYSDGGPGETQYLPGHSQKRLTDFASAKQPVGDDEQYAAAFALAANAVGLPARVVVGAKPEPNGDVKGSDIHTWVEIHDANGAWILLDRSQFMPKETSKPQTQQQATQKSVKVEQAPPPSPALPPGNINDQISTDSNATRHSQPGNSGFHIPAVVIAALKIIGIPLLLLLLVVGAITGLKARRRRIRRTRGHPAAQVASGWREVLDRARDLGHDIDSGSTRLEQAVTMDIPAIAQLANTADARVFGPEEPDQTAAEHFWKGVDETRGHMVADLGFWRRTRAAVSLRSLGNPITILRGTAQ